MARFDLCDECGSTLDHGEICDCKNKKNRCVYCNKVIKWGEIAVHQEICYDCYIQKIKDIIFDLDEEKASLVTTCLDIFIEIHKGRGGCK